MRNTDADADAADTNHHSARDVAGAVADGRQDSGGPNICLTPWSMRMIAMCPQIAGCKEGAARSGDRPASADRGQGCQVGFNIIAISRRVLAVW